MRWILKLRILFRSLFRLRQNDRELGEELRFHVDRQIQENIAAGMTPPEARRSAAVEFGGMDQVREECREVRGWTILENTWRDLQFAARSLAKQPMLVFAAVASLGLGIGANTTIYSLFREVVLMPPTARDPGRLIDFWMGHGSHVSYQEYRDLQESTVLAGIAGYQIEREVNLRLGDSTRALFPFFVTANFFDVLGVDTALGRTFTAAEARPELDPRLVVVSYGFWQRTLGGEPQALGRVLNLNGEAYTILGVLPREMRSVFGYGVAPEVYLPLNVHLMPDLYQPREAIVSLIGRLHEGMTLEHARAALETAGKRLAQSYPTGRKGFGTVDRLHALDSPKRFAELPLLPIFGVFAVVVSLVLVIACANIAGLLLARGAARYREIAVRLAIGASRGRLMRQLLVESLLLAAIGAAFGVLLTYHLTQVMRSVPLPTPIPFEFHLRPDASLLGVATALALVTAVLCGMAPALQSTRPNLALALKQEEPRFARRRLAWRKVLVGGQVAASAVLLVTGFLFLRNLWHTATADPGFDIARTVWAEVALIPHRYTEETHRLFADHVLERLRVMPSVRSAACAVGVPLTLRSNAIRGGFVEIEGIEGKHHVQRSVNWIGDDYFGTMGIPLLQGREFTEGDMRKPVVIVNERFMRLYSQGRSLVGKRLTEEGKLSFEIVGVVGDSKYRSLGEAPSAALYFPYRPRGARINFLISTAGPPEAAISAVNRAIQEVDPLAAVETRTMHEGLAFAFLPSKVGAVLLGSLGLLGTVLAMVGLYGLMSYSVSRRTAEIGIRMALGATERMILRMVLSDAMAVAGMGLGIGLAIAFFVTGPLAIFLVPGLTPSDPVSYLGTALLLGFVALAAGLAPARRASRLSPLTSLRYE